MNFRFLITAHKDSVNWPLLLVRLIFHHSLSQRLCPPATPKFLLFPKQVMCFIAFLALNILLHLLGMLFSLLCLIIPTGTSRAVSLLLHLQFFFKKPPYSFLLIGTFFCCVFKSLCSWEVLTFVMPNLSPILRAFRKNCHIHP